LSRSVFRRPLDVERTDEPAILVDEINGGGVIHAVATLERHFVVIDVVGLSSPRRPLLGHRGPRRTTPAAGEGPR